MKKNNLNNKGPYILLFTAVIWGLSFIAQSVASDSVGPFTFNSLRFLLGSLVLIPFVLKNAKKANISFIQIIKDNLIGGIICAAFLSTASVLQQIGVAESGAGKGGFITSLYLIIVPLIAIIFKEKVKVQHIVFSFVALIGLYLLSIKEGFTISSGDIYLILCAIVFAFHIIAIDRLKKCDSITLSMLQFFFSFILCGIFMLIFEDLNFDAIFSASIPIMYAGFLSCGVAYTLQIVGQKTTEPTLATIILSSESLFAALFSWIILSETLSNKELIGSFILFIAVLGSQLTFPRKAKKN